MDEKEKVVTERICRIIHKQVDDKFESINDCMNEIKGAIAEMRDVVTKMAEIAAGNKEILQILMDERKTHTKEPSPQQVSVNEKYVFWNTKAGQLIPWLAFIFAVITVAALVGTNLIEAWRQVKDYIPTVKG